MISLNDRTRLIVYLANLFTFLGDLLLLSFFTFYIGQIDHLLIDLRRQIIIKLLV